MRFYCLGLVCLLSSSLGTAAVWGITGPPQQAIDVEILEDPLGLSFVQENLLLTEVRSDRHSAVYLIDGKDRVDLVGPPATRQEYPTTALTYHTTDGRVVVVTIGEALEGAIQVRVAPSQKGEFEKIGIVFRVGPNEGFYGLMERVVQGSQGYSWEPGMSAGLNLRGQTVDLYTLPTVSAYSPFFVSSAGYGVYVEGNWPGTYRFGVSAQGKTVPTEVAIEYEGPELTFRLIPGPTLLEVVERYAHAVGMPLLPPRFAFGPYRWRDVVWDLPTFYDGTPYDGVYNSMIVEDVLMMEALGIPCTMYCIDRPWGEGSFGYGSMEVDEERLPQFDAMLNWLNGKAIKPILFVGPWVMETMRDEATKEGYHVENSIPYLPQAALIDFTNPEAVVWWQNHLLDMIERGIAGFKLDRGEEKTPDGQLFRGSYHDGTPYREGHNAYPLWYAQAAHGALERAGDRDLINLIRAAWAGTSQYAIVWGGDTAPTAWGLRSAIIALQRCAVLNIPIWGSDTGGYNERPPREVLGRWLAFSAFCPLMEVGPMANLAPWSWLPDNSTFEIGEDGYKAEPIYDEGLIASWIFYANLHNDLVDYTYEQAQRAHEHGTPIVRPMIFAYPDSSEYLDVFEQYLYGPDLLVRPIWEEGATQVVVHIPEGNWVNAWSGELVTGPTAVTVDAPWPLIPIFIRQGAVISLGDLQGRWEDAQDQAAQRPDLAVLAQAVK